MIKNICISFLLIAGFACKKESQPIIYYTDNIVVAHRGAWADGHCPQNSLASLQKAIEMKCIGSEFDVWLTKDDSLIVEHDPTYAGKNVETTTYAKLSATKLSNGETLPTLRQYLLAAQGQTQTKLFLEVKSMAYDNTILYAITDRVLDLVAETQMQNYMVYSSFHFTILQRIHQRVPDAKTHFLGGTYTPEDVKSAGITGIDYDIDSFYDHLNWLPDAKKDSLSLGAWTVDNDQQFIWLINNKFNYIITDAPNELFRVLDNMR
ncbi:MAG: glycerophosphodiester phosphodiesterase family protein [Parafilimonas sp.]